ncbi:Aspartate aminotransferase [Botrimarina colliarenosi]|uniref:Aminotransferase n=1 Tax=Botrimarina colliarenosi TaxID=2528001 RepID=A0A5C6ABS4_9BACT|nr:amino acid aminotransferase [Botrimarina colliarenosi]TWT96856.1 Aspartate aminotransferase [Botrimarina colliarenosi]
MFESIEAAPVDPILGLTDAYKAETRPGKINLGVGVYQDEDGVTPVLPSVVEATRRVTASEKTKSYLPIPGAPEYGAAVQLLMLGGGHEVLISDRASTSHTPGGTGALRVVGDFLKQNLPGATLWMTDPTWANHPAIFAAAGVKTGVLPYFDAAANGLAFEAFLTALKKLPAGDAVLLHGCCHNPTGIDPTLEQWRQIAAVLADRGVLPVLDFAYQGFGDGVEEDAAGLREFCTPGAELIICSSFSKNFGLYRERVGAVTFVSQDAERRAVVQSQVNRVIRTIYSNPPAHGAALVTTILADADLKKQWLGELEHMRNRINGMRTLLVEKLAEHGAAGDYSFIQQQRGMFSFSGLTKEQVAKLRENDAIYLVGSGRINVAGITPTNVDALAKAIVAVL